MNTQPGTKKPREFADGKTGKEFASRPDSGSSTDKIPAESKGNGNAPTIPYKEVPVRPNPQGNTNAEQAAR